MLFGVSTGFGNCLSFQYVLSFVLKKLPRQILCFQYLLSFVLLREEWT